jgi:hypothetical protein
MHPDFSAAKIEKKSAQITRANTVVAHHNFANAPTENAINSDLWQLCRCLLEQFISA